MTALSRSALLGSAMLAPSPASVDVRNVGNAQYFGGLIWGQAYYAAPRNVSGALSFNY
ncbi:hypothetical protein [Sphingomonas sp. KR3-1]|uniref:hypothetical protein n=1 Tax=Sphingomonas sp. KR3-1 TaxID=3156611 RepID=UPI0032B609E5